MVLQVLSTDHCFLLSFLSDWFFSSFLFLLVSVTTGSTHSTWSSFKIHKSSVVLLLQDITSICAVMLVLSWKFTLSLSGVLKVLRRHQEMGYLKKVYLLVCAKRLRRSPERTVQNDLKALALVFLKRWWETDSFSQTSDHSPSEMCTWVAHLRKGSAPPVIRSHQYQPWCWVDALLSLVQLSFSKSQLVLFSMACKKVCWTCTIWMGCRHYLVLLVVTRTPTTKTRKKAEQ